MVYIEIHRAFSHMSIFWWLCSGKKQLHLNPCRLDMRICCQNWPQKNKSVSFSAIRSPQNTRDTPGTEKWIEHNRTDVYFITRDFQTFFSPTLELAIHLWFKSLVATGGLVHDLFKEVWLVISPLVHRIFFDQSCWWFLRILVHQNHQNVGGE